MIESRDLGADDACVVCFLAEVQLLTEAVLELAHGLQQAVARAELREPRRQRGELSQDLDVNFNPPSYARPLDFDGNLLAVREDGAVHLGHRRGGQRLPVE